MFTFFVPSENKSDCFRSHLWKKESISLFTVKFRILWNSILLLFVKQVLFIWGSYMLNLLVFSETERAWGRRFSPIPLPLQSQGKESIRNLFFYSKPVF